MRCLFLRDLNCSESINVNTSQNSQIPGSGDSPEHRGQDQPGLLCLSPSSLSSTSLRRPPERGGYRNPLAGTRMLQELQLSRACECWLVITYIYFCVVKTGWNLALPTLPELVHSRKLISVFIRVQHHCHTGNRRLKATGSPGPPAPPWLLAEVLSGLSWPPCHQVRACRWHPAAASSFCSGRPLRCWQPLHSTCHATRHRPPKPVMPSDFPTQQRAGWHHWLNGHEFEQTPGDGEGQGSLVCCSPWEAESWIWLNWLNNRCLLYNQQFAFFGYLVAWLLIEAQT